MLSDVCGIAFSMKKYKKIVVFFMKFKNKTETTFDIRIKIIFSAN